MASYTTTQLIARVKRWGNIPTTQPLFSESDFINLLDEELQYATTPLIHSIREEFFIKKYSTTIVSGQKEYILPTRAIGGVIKDVFIEDSSSNQYLLRKVSSHDRNDYSNGYYIMGNRLVFVDESTHVGKTLAVYYPMRPNSLVALLDAAQISNITGTDVTVGSRPSSWTSADTFDLVQNNMPFDSLAIDQTVSLSVNTFTFSSVPTQLAVGDWVCLAGESPIPQIPVEVMNYLCQGVVVKCLEALGDQVSHQIAKSKYEKMEKDIINILTPRTTDQPTKIVNSYNLSHRATNYLI